MIKFVYLLPIILIPYGAFAQQLGLEIESGSTRIEQNDFSDNEGGNLIRFTSDFEDELQLNLRASLYFTDSERKNQFFIKLVFLDYEVSGILPRDVRFEGTVFNEGTSATAQSKFNGYRIGWSRLFGQESKFKYRLGFTANIRDGLIAIENENNREQFSNDGGAVVPLLNAGIEYEFFKWLSLSSFFEGLYVGSTGSLIDLDVALNLYLAQSLIVKAGVRRIQGLTSMDSLLMSWHIILFY